mmetsp:Transcript_11817/g.16906  ORF Transcript_11817/g.16906 Transcript_11817/m.16906 type:complete len:197 (-) Transcript_11817:571-1161(-)
MLGISLFFNKSLMRIGNLSLIAGVPMTIGPGRTAGYFFQPQKSRATGCLALGILLVFIGWPIFGIALEIFGLLNLFGNMFPVLIVVMKQMPVVGPILNGITGKSKGKGKGKGAAARKNKYQSQSRDDDDYYYNDADADADAKGCPHPMVAVPAQTFGKNVGDDKRSLLKFQQRSIKHRPHAANHHPKSRPSKNGPI